MKKRIVIAILVCNCVLMSCASDVNSKDVEKQIESLGQEIVDQVENISQTEDEHVLMVKHGYPMSYPECEYGDVFDEFFGSPTWKYFEADTGEQVVEFTGYCIYQDVEVKARLQFILDMENRTFESGAMSFNDVPQSTLITTAMIQKAFEFYMEENGIEASTGNALEDELSDAFISETEANDNISDKSINMDEGSNEDIAKNPGLVTVKDIINTQWAMTPNEEYSFLVVGEEGDTEFDTVEVYIIETDNPDNVLYHGWSGTITGTEMVDLYITVGFGSSDEFALIWQNFELIDYPRLEALENTTIEFEGDYHYYGLVR